jgi:peptidyl-tRNA hydrolase, PTH1 family
VVSLVVGLGNPGRRYSGTRHNVGFMVVEMLRERAGEPGESEACHSALWRTAVEGREIVVARPLVFMNRSGGPVRALAEKHGASPEEILVVADDFHLDFGALRLRRSGSHGGHNGLRSIITSLATQDFPRLRIGVGAPPEGEDPADFVLERFTRDERDRLDEIVARAADCVGTVLQAGLEAGMNRYNRPNEGK